MCLVAVGHPFDLLKVRLQTSNQYTGALDCMRKTMARDGVRGLYRGMSAPLVGVTPIFAVCFWGYDVGKQLSRWAYSQDKSAALSMGQIMFAGGFSAIPTTLIMAPGERIKVLLQIQGQHAEKGIPPKYSGPVDVIKQLAREGGIRSIFRGTFATLLRDVPGSVAYFGVYEGCKRLFTPAGSSLNPLAIFVAGGLGGMANWLVAIPPDVLKSRYQSAPEGQYRGLWGVLKDVLRESGVRGLFKGVGPAMARAFPANAACFLGVELSRSLLDRMW